MNKTNHANKSNPKKIFADKIERYLKNFEIMPEYIERGRERLDKFYILYKEIVEWNKKINITAITDENGFIKKHIIDGAFLFKILDKKIRYIIDIGSGAGFPGLVLNVLNPSLNIISVESVSKKCAFQKNIARILNLFNFNCVNLNIFSFGFNENIDAIVTRAAFNAAELINLIEKLNFQRNTDLYLFLSEIKEVKKIIDFKYKSKFLFLDRILFYKTEHLDYSNTKTGFRLIAKIIAASKSKRPLSDSNALSGAA